eukprot:GILJ01011652.1.p1 GENE.GILJ01011652.1~~GILJ01011652.1.p1  ORF type:complete len:301 (-),score=49.38 GILJ01011652.1:127-1029(-)
MIGAAYFESNLPALTLLGRGKVRDVYKVDEHNLLFIATDRLSAFDVVLQTGIPNKGKLLNQLSLFWFDLLKELGPNHLITADVDQMPEIVRQYKDQIEGRCMLVKKLTMLPIEAIVRGYLSGSALKEYNASGTVHGIQVPAGLKNSEKFPTPIFTPSTKAEVGIHDENIHPDRAAEIIGAERAAKLAEQAIALYTKASEYAATKGIILADTKFEFGLDENDNMILGDEVLTPDSSRFWPVDKYEVGRNQDSYDKQYVRDYLESISFDKQTPIPLPDDVVTRTRDKYLEIYRILTGKDVQV